jgi:hypothetical protein
VQIGRRRQRPGELDGEGVWQVIRRQLLPAGKAHHPIVVLRRGGKALPPSRRVHQTHGERNPVLNPVAADLHRGRYTALPQETGADNSPAAGVVPIGLTRDLVVSFNTCE